MLFLGTFPLAHIRDWETYTLERGLIETTPRHARRTLRARLKETYDIISAEGRQECPKRSTRVVPQQLCGQLLQWTDTQEGSLLYDSAREEDSVRAISAHLLGRSRVAIVVVTQDNDVFGIYVPHFAHCKDRLCVIEDSSDASFLFAFNTNGRCMTPARWVQSQSTLSIRVHQDAFISFVVAHEQEVETQREKIERMDTINPRKERERTPSPSTRLKTGLDALPKAILSISWNTEQDVPQAGIFAAHLEHAYGIDKKTLIGTAPVNSARIVALQLS